MSETNEEQAALLDALSKQEGEALAESLRSMLAASVGLANARDDKGTSALRLALYRRQDAARDVLLEAGPELDVHDAAAIGDVETLQARLDADADSLDRLSGDGFSPLHLASFFDQPAAASLLLEKGADANAEGSATKGLRPLHSAIAGKAPVVARALLSGGADVNAQQEGGWSALHAAAKAGEMELVLLLLEHEADMELKAEDGRTARELAEDEGQDDVTLLLFRYS